MTIDYRPVNAMRVPIPGTSPGLSTNVQEIDDAYGFANFDMPSGFCQLPLHEDVRNAAVFTPTRVPQGATNSAFHFKSQMQVVFKDMLYHELLILIDDILLYARDPVASVNAVRRFFAQARKHHLKLSVKKRCPLREKAKFCGRLFSGVGVRYDPKRVSALQPVPLRTTVAELQQFLYAAGWMRDALMDFGRVMEALHARFKAVLHVVGRTKTTGGRRAACALLSASQTLHFLSDNSEICVVTDASERGWGLAVTQVACWCDATPPAEQLHELLEAYPIVWASRNLGYLLVRTFGVRLFCDRKNLVYVLLPTDEMKSHIQGKLKLQRWALSLTRLQYQIEHIDGSMDVWADLLSRWGLPSTHAVASSPCKYVTRGSAQLAAPTPAGPRLRLRADNFVFTTLDKVVAVQLRQARFATKNATQQNGKVTREDNLITRVLVVLDCGIQGHQGFEAIMTTVSSVFELRGIEQLCRRFLSYCLICRHVKGRSIEPGPWGPTYDASERNEILHVDFLFLGDSVGAAKWADSLLRARRKQFRLQRSGRRGTRLLVEAVRRPAHPAQRPGNHFKSEVVSQVCKHLSIDQKLVVAYSPWINSSVERLNQDILQILRALYPELRLATLEWPYLIPIVLGNLDYTPVRSHCDTSPTKQFTGLPRPSLFEPIKHPNARTSRSSSGTAGETRESLHAMHPVAVNQRDQRLEQNKAKSKGNPCNFSIGDFVLWSRINTGLISNKLLARWVGPFAVIVSAPHSLTIQHLATNQQYIVHPSLLKFYSDSSLEVTEELLAHVGNQGVVLSVRDIKARRKERGVWQVLIAWEGLQDEEDSWELLTSMIADIPDRAQAYVVAAADTQLTMAVTRIGRP
ncbi:hypothetical protein PybrP1_006446 [[Pythium] brassicae (nom. inval.)]|nr:hypothetical protein PybrP1_006446 [[Pythium] brassicae (nom. inval.)]